MSGDYFEGKLNLVHYSDLISELEKETKIFNSKLEKEGILEFSLKECKSPTSLVSRTFGEPEVIFSLVKEKPSKIENKFTSIYFKNKICLNRHNYNSKLKKLNAIFRESNERLLNFYDKRNLEN